MSVEGAGTGEDPAFIDWVRNASAEELLAWWNGENE